MKIHGQEIELGSFVFNHPGIRVAHVTLVMRTYCSDVGTPSLRLIDFKTRDHFWTLSSNLSEYRVEPDEFCTFFKCYGENEGLLEVLLSTGLVSLTGRSLDSEHVSFPEVKIDTTDAVWEEFKELCRRASNPTEL